MEVMAQTVCRSAKAINSCPSSWIPAPSNHGAVLDRAGHVGHLDARADRLGKLGRAMQVFMNGDLRQLDGGAGESRHLPAADDHGGSELVRPLVHGTAESAFYKPFYQPMIDPNWYTARKLDDGSGGLRP
jgi:hypothetical protein